MENFESSIDIITIVLVIFAHLILKISRISQLFTSFRYKSSESLSLLKLCLYLVGDILMLVSLFLFYNHNWKHTIIYSWIFFLGLDFIAIAQYAFNWKRDTSKKVQWKHVSLNQRNHGSMSQTLPNRRLSNSSLRASNLNPEESLILGSSPLLSMGINYSEEYPQKVSHSNNYPVWNENLSYPSLEDLDKLDAHKTVEDPKNSKKRKSIKKKHSNILNNTRQRKNSNPIQFSNNDNNLNAENPTYDSSFNEFTNSYDSQNDSKYWKQNNKKPPETNGMKRNDSTLDTDEFSEGNAFDYYQRAEISGDLGAYDTDDSVYSDHESAYYKGTKNSSWKIVSNFDNRNIGNLGNSRNRSISETYRTRPIRKKTNSRDSGNGMFLFRSKQSREPNLDEIVSVKSAFASPHKNNQQESNQYTQSPHFNMARTPQAINDNSIALYSNSSAVISAILSLPFFNWIVNKNIVQFFNQIVNQDGINYSPNEKHSIGTISGLPTLWTLDSNQKIIAYIFFFTALNLYFIGEISQFFWNLKHRKTRGLSRFSSILNSISCILLLFAIIPVFILGNNHVEHLGVFLPLVIILALIAIFDLLLWTQIVITRIPPKQIIIDGENGPLIPQYNA